MVGSRGPSTSRKLRSSGRRGRRSSSGRAVLTACAALAFAIGCTPSTSAPPVIRRDETTCPRLDSRLLQLSNASDPEAFARSARLDLNTDGVVVVIDLTPNSDIPAGHRVTVQGRYLNTVQARVPVGELCPLASESAVARLSVQIVEPK